jgi:hypothetical protein
MYTEDGLAVRSEHSKLFASAVPRSREATIYSDQLSAQIQAGKLCFRR